MKKFFYILLVCTLGANAQDHHINFVDVELDSAYKLAKAENKLVFVDCYTVWCGPCKWMEANVFTNKNVAQYFNENFINVKLDMEKGEGRVFAGRYDVYSYPTYIFLDVSERRRELVHRGVGSREADAFIEFAKTASNEEERFGTFKKEFDKGNRDPEFIRAYIKKQFESGYRGDANSNCYWLYNNYDWSTVTKENLDNFYMFINSNSHPFIESFLSNLPTIEKVADPNELYSFMFRTLAMPIWIGLRSEDPNLVYVDITSKVKSISYSQKTKLLAEIDLTFYQRTDFEKFMEIAPELVNKYFMDDAVQLNSLAWSVYESSENKDDFKVALTWANKSVHLNAGYNNTDTQMRLLYETGKTKAALAAGEKALQFLKDDNASESRIKEHQDVMAAIKKGEELKK